MTAREREREGGREGEGGRDGDGERQEGALSQGSMAWSSVD